MIVRNLNRTRLLETGLGGLGFTPVTGMYGAPACSKGDPWTASSAECIAQLDANQQHDMGQRNLSNYDIDLANCLAMFPQPPDCYQRTFGLTPVGGYTGGWNRDVPNAQLFITGVPPSDPVPEYIPPPAAPPPAPTPTPTAKANQVNNQSPSTQTDLMHDTTGGISLVDQGKSLLSETVNLLGHDIPVWMLGAAALAAVVVVRKG